MNLRVYTRLLIAILQIRLYLATLTPTHQPSGVPTSSPSSARNLVRSVEPTSVTLSPSSRPTLLPTGYPTSHPTSAPSYRSGCIQSSLNLDGTNIIYNNAFNAVLLNATRRSIPSVDFTRTDISAGTTTLLTFDACFGIS